MNEEMSHQEFFKLVNIYSAGLENVRECVEQGTMTKRFPAIGHIWKNGSLLSQKRPHITARRTRTK